MMQKVEKKFKEQQHQNSSNETRAKEGETIIDKAPNTKEKSNKDVGEYVDFEDIE